MTAFNGYPISIVLALFMHGVIFASLLWVQRASTEVLNVERPPVVKAVLVQENPQARNERVEQQRLEDQRAAEQQRREEEQRRQEQEQERQAQLERERQQQAEEERRQAELQAQREREQQEAEQRRQEEERRRQEEEQRRQEEDRRRQEEEQRRQAEAEAERQRQEQARIQQEAAERAETDAEIIASYTSIIHDLVQQRWSRPPSARNNMEAVLRIRLLPTGDLVDVEIVRSSGDDAFDRAAENAVRAVGRFSELQGMPPRLFERSFRSLLLTFRPEDLRN